MLFSAAKGYRIFHFIAPPFLEGQDVEMSYLEKKNMKMFYYRLVLYILVNGKYVSTFLI
mgnify:CR=1 FL=1